MAAATSITRAHQILLGRINAALAPFSLTFSRFEVLTLLYFSQKQELPMGKIGARLQVHPTSVTSLVNRLVSDGHVRRVPHPDDRRTTLVRLEPHTPALVDECRHALESISFGIDGLSPSACQDVEVQLRALRRQAGDWEPDAT